MLCYNDYMNDQNNSYPNILPNNDQYVGESNPTKKPKVFWIIGGVSALLILVIVLVVVLVNRNNTDYSMINDDIGASEFSFERDDAYSELQNIFLNMDDGMSLEQLRKIISLSGVAENYLQVNRDNPSDTIPEETEESEFSTSDGAESFIAPVIIHEGTDYSGQTIEFISFNVLPVDDDASEEMIDNVTYHNYKDGLHNYINSTSDYEFTHHYEGYSNSFDNKFDAIDDFVSRISL